MHIRHVFDFFKKIILLNFSIIVDMENADETRRFSVSIQKCKLKIKTSIKNPIAEKLKAKHANSILSLKFRKNSLNAASKAI